MPVAPLHIKNSAHHIFHTGLDLSALGDTVRNNAAISISTPMICIGVTDSLKRIIPAAVDTNRDEHPINDVIDTGPDDIACILHSKNAAMTQPYSIPHCRVATPMGWNP